MFQAGTLGPSWFEVLESLQNADYVFSTRGTGPVLLARLAQQPWAPTPGPVICRNAQSALEAMGRVSTVF